jgi:hypothetical protein
MASSCVVNDPSVQAAGTWSGRHFTYLLAVDSSVLHKAPIHTLKGAFCAAEAQKLTDCFLGLPIASWTLYFSQAQVAVVAESILPSLLVVFTWESLSGMGSSPLVHWFQDDWSRERNDCILGTSPCLGSQVVHSLWGVK